MPIKPPNLDDRRYDDIVREARALIPQYTPEWTNLGDADPGITLVQLFAWMTEMTIFRLNRVPDASNTSLPVDMSAEIAEAGAVVCRGLDDMLERLTAMAEQRIAADPGTAT